MYTTDLNPSDIRKKLHEFNMNAANIDIVESFIAKLSTSSLIDYVYSPSAGDYMLGRSLIAAEIDKRKEHQSQRNYTTSIITVVIAIIALIVSLISLIK